MKRLFFHRMSIFMASSLVLLSCGPKSTHGCIESFDPKDTVFVVVALTKEDNPISEIQVGDTISSSVLSSWSKGDKWTIELQSLDTGLSYFCKIQSSQEDSNSADFVKYFFKSTRLSTSKVAP